MGVGTRWWLVVAATLVQVAPCTPSFAQALPDDLQALEQRVENLWKSGKFAAAVPFADQYIEATRQRYGVYHVFYGNALSWLAELYRSQGHYDLAEPLFKRWLAIRETVRGADHPDIVAPLQALADLYVTQARYDAADPLFRRAFAISVKAKGPDNADVASVLDSLGTLERARGKLDVAESLIQRALAIREKLLGPGSPYVAATLSNLAALYNEQGRYTEAEPLYKRYVAIYEKALGPEHPDVAGALSNLAFFYDNRGRYRDAEPLYLRSLAIREKALGPEHPDVGVVASNLGLLYLALGDFGAAEPLLKRSLAIREHSFGPDHPDVALALNNLGGLYQEKGKYELAKPLFERVLSIRERTLGPDHPDVANALNNLAGLYRDLGRYDLAEPMEKRCLTIRETAYGLDHPDVASALNSLAHIYEQKGLNAEALPLYQRALAIREKALGPQHPHVADSLNNIALLLETLGRYAEAEPLLLRSLAIRKEVLGPAHPELAQSLNNLAAFYDDQKKYDLSEPYLLRALAIKEKALGPDHEDVATSVNNLAEHYRERGQFDLAAPLYARAIAIVEKSLGPDHPHLATSLHNAAVLSFQQGKWATAADFLDRSTAILIRRFERGTASLGRTQTATGESDTDRDSISFSTLVKADYRLAREPRGTSPQGFESFEAAQWATGTKAARSLAQMAARSAAGDPALAGLVRERQDLVGEWQGKDDQLISSRANPPERRKPDAEKALNDRLSAIDARLMEIDQRLVKDFPNYAAIAASRPTSVADVQALLRNDEALVLFLDTSKSDPAPEETFIWVVTKSDMRWVRSDLGTMALKERVALLRCGVDLDGEWKWVGEQSRWIARKPACAALRPDGLARDEPPPFDLARAHELYEALFGQIEDLIDRKHLLIIPSGALTSLPLHVLVSSLSSGGPSGDRAREVALLGAQMKNVPEVTAKELRLDNGRGTLITELTPGGPGAAAGLKPNDILISVGEANVAGYLQAIDVIRSNAPGSIVQIRLLRDGNEKLISVALGSTMLHEWIPRFLGTTSTEDVSWLLRRHAITVVPSVSSLATLRRHSGGSSATEAFVGFGNPLLMGRDGTDRRAWAKQVCPKIALLPESVHAVSWSSPSSFLSFFRAGVADVAALRNQPPLPETADELCAVAQELGASEDHVNLGARATETHVRELNAEGALAKARVVHFATHGLLASEAESIAKSSADPALLLTPPDAPSATDDGLLTASEVTDLKLNADWVVLSACNTAAGGDKGDAEALSGLARAFFYAGARSLLVSHWRVDSRTAVKITTGAFAELAHDPSIGRAEALRRSMLAAMTDPDRPVSWTPASHPSVWAPFVVVGEGGARW